MNRKIFSLTLAVIMLAGLGLVLVPAQANVVYGDVDGNGHINAADVTLLRRRVSQGNENGLPSNYNRQNADVNGDTFIDINDVNLLRRHVAAVDPSTVPLGPTSFPLPTGKFISLTSDDGPAGGTTSGGTNATATMLNHLQTLNARSTVVCGRNGPMPCTASRAGRYGTCVRQGGSSCGTVSRAHISFYVQGSAIGATPGANARTLMRRMLAEGHSVENHTIGHGINADNVRNEITGNNTRIRTALHGTESITDFYGNVWSNSNPYKVFSFRPNNFRMNPAFRGVDKETDMPWIFAGLDTGDWITEHKADMMSDWLMNGRFTGGVGTYSSTNRACPCTWWCPLRETGGTGARGSGIAHDGGIVLIHDTATANGMDAAAFLNTVAPQLQTAGYHLVTIEKMFEYMDSEWAWTTNANAASIQTGDGSGTRFNDWVVRGARRTGTAPRPSVVRGGTFVQGN